jgi:hypothetical protein
LYVAPALQTVPSGSQPPAPDAATTPHTPSVKPACFVQRPPQQSVSVAHASPVWMQNDGCEQRPLLQYCEAHCEFMVQGSPVVPVDPLSEAHVPALHFSLQHSPSAVHAPLSATHWVAEHAPPTHDTVQQPRLFVHAAPGFAHVPDAPMHVFVVGSQFTEQQSVSVAQVLPFVVQAAGVPTPSMPASFSVAIAPSLPLSPPSPLPIVA